MKTAHTRINAIVNVMWWIKRFKNTKVSGTEIEKAKLSLSGDTIPKCL